MREFHSSNHSTYEASIGYGFNQLDYFAWFFNLIDLLTAELPGLLGGSLSLSENVAAWHPCEPFPVTMPSIWVENSALSLFCWLPRVCNLAILLVTTPLLGGLLTAALYFRPDAALLWWLLGVLSRTELQPHGLSTSNISLCRAPLSACPLGEIKRSRNLVAGMSSKETSGSEMFAAPNGEPLFVYSWPQHWSAYSSQ